VRASGAQSGARGARHQVASPAAGDFRARHALSSAPVSAPFSWFRLRSSEPVPLVLYTKAGCCLCDEMKRELARSRTARPWRLEERDIERDPALFERFGRSIPVLEIGGRVAFKGRLTRGEFERKFARLAAEWEARAQPPAQAGKEG
jgi:hypothetical protein